jgi:hypothetical protein
MNQEDQILDIRQHRSTLYEQNAYNFRVVNLFLVIENGIENISQHF